VYQFIKVTFAVNDEVEDEADWVTMNSKVRLRCTQVRLH